MTAKNAPKEPLKAFGPNGTVVALSYDGGKRWGATPAARKAAEEAAQPKARVYTRRIAAVLPAQGPTPSWTRRIATSFGPLADAGILAGWGPLASLLESERGLLDAIVVPYGAIPGTAADVVAVLAELRAVAPRIFVDIDSTVVRSRDDLETIQGLVREADAVILPNELVAQTLRKFNPNTFCVPPTIDPARWSGLHREPSPDGRVRVALQPGGDRFAAEAVEWIRARYPERVEVVADEWAARSPVDDPAFYVGIDVLVVGAPASRTTLDNANLLPAMHSGCCVVVDGAYNRTVLHGHSGILVTAKGPSAWRKEMQHAVTDGRTRGKMQRGARERARLFAGRVLLNRLALPYRVMIPEAK